MRNLAEAAEKVETMESHSRYEKSYRCGKCTTQVVQGEWQGKQERPTANTSTGEEAT